MFKSRHKYFIKLVSLIITKLFHLEKAHAIGLSFSLLHTGRQGYTGRQTQWTSVTALVAQELAG
jgi:hypothetical protein